MNKKAYLRGFFDGIKNMTDIDENELDKIMSSHENMTKKSKCKYDDGHSVKSRKKKKKKPKPKKMKYF